jgi:hypothetical protein
MEQWIVRGWLQLETLIATLPVRNTETGEWELMEMYVCNQETNEVYSFDRIIGAMQTKYIEQVNEDLPIHKQMNKFLKAQQNSRLHPLQKGMLFTHHEDRSVVVPLVQAVCESYIQALRQPESGLQPALHRDEILDVSYERRKC